MDNIKILFLNLSNDSDASSQNCNQVLEHINSLENLKVVEVKYDIQQAESELQKKEYDVLIMCVGSNNSDAWKQLDNFLEKEDKLYYLGFIVIFCFRENEITENARKTNACKTLFRKIYPFFSPVDCWVLEAYIEERASSMKYQKSLGDLKKKLFEANDLDSIVTNALNALQELKKVEYTRATISLVDNKTKNLKRYLFKPNDKSRPLPNRSLQKDIQDDKLISRVNTKTVFIIENLDEIRSQDEEIKQQKFMDLGWDDEPPTNEINSWIGLAAKRQNKTVAIFTLDHKKAGQYEEDDQNLRRFLKDFGEIFADAIEDFFLKRNVEVREEIINEIGDNLKGEDLVKQILQKLQNVLDCDNCNYFLVDYNPDEKGDPESRVFLKEWISAKDGLDAAIKQTNKSVHQFKKGEGIVGAVLMDRKSRIVPHASEDNEFLPTLNHPGYNLSMLAVPVINKPNRIIGVICCNKSKPDHFTIYDRDLVEDVALSTASIIERTKILESSNEISSRMAKLVLDPVKNELLKKICEYAMNVTNAGTASIHLLERSRDGEYKSIKYPYYTFPVEEEAEPRLDGKGTTDKVIAERKTIEFSEKCGNFDLIAEDQRQRGVKCKLVVPLIINENDDPTIINENDDSTIIGALYLSKYSEDQFSKVEKFALKLFASQAASIIYGQSLLSENEFSVKAYEKLQEASERIANTNIDLQLLKLIAQYSYDLVHENLKYPNRNSQSEDESKLPVLVSYVLFYDEGDYHVKAAWPEYELTALMKKYDDEIKKEDRKKGIAGLAIERKESVLVDNIVEHKEKKTTEDKEYIEFKKTTRTQLAVPILDDKLDDNNTEKKEVLGVINLEYSQPYAFKEFHQNVIEIFARQVAIAYQKKNLIDNITNNNKILQSLHQSLNKITQKSPKNMLYEAVSQTREALGAEQVIVIPIEKKTILKDEIVPIYDEIVPIYKDWMEALDNDSKEVYRNEKDEIFPVKKLKKMFDNINKEKFEKLGFISGLCLPFSSGDYKIGVMWILFSRLIDTDQLKKNQDIYRVYANQIALAYANSKRFEELKIKDSKNLSRRINRDRDNVRWQAIIWFLASLISAVIGLSLIFYSFTPSLEGTSENPQDQRGFNVAFGLLLQGVTVLAFNQGMKANERMDKYHKELYDAHQLSILLSATEELDLEIMQEEKRKIIQTTTNHWFKSTNDVSNTDK